MQEQVAIHHLLLGGLEPEIVGFDHAPFTGSGALDRGIGVQPEDMNDAVLGSPSLVWRSTQNSNA